MNFFRLFCYFYFFPLQLSSWIKLRRIVKARCKNLQRFRVCLTWEKEKISRQFAPLLPCFLTTWWKMIEILRSTEKKFCCALRSLGYGKWVNWKNIKERVEFRLIFFPFLFSRECISRHYLCGICVGATTASETLNDISESSVELDASLCTSCLLLFLLLLFNFGCLSLNFTSTSQRSVHFTSEHWNCQVQFHAAQAWHLEVVAEDFSLARKCEFIMDSLEKWKFGLGEKNLKNLLVQSTKIIDDFHLKIVKLS